MLQLPVAEAQATAGALEPSESHTTRASRVRVRPNGFTVVSEGGGRPAIECVDFSSQWVSLTSI